MNDFLKRLELKDIAVRYTRSVITVLFASFAFFVTFLILAGFGLAIAYIAHLIVNIGSDRPEKFAVPEWVKPYERWSVGLFILSLIFLAGLQPWKDALRYFRYETIEPEESENKESEKTKEDDTGHKSKATKEKIEQPDPALAAKGVETEGSMGNMNIVASREAEAEGEKPAESVPLVSSRQIKRKDRRRKRH